MFDNSLLAEIKNRLNLVSIIANDTGQQPQKAGQSFRFACPIHNGTKENNFSVYGQTWKCYSGDCGKGDIFKWGMVFHRWDFQTAVNEYARLAGVDIGTPTLPAKRRTPPQKPVTVNIDYPPDTLWQNEVSDIATGCYCCLWSEAGNKPLEWLYQRGLTEETLKTFQIGYNPTSRKISKHWVYGGVIIPHYQWETMTLWGVKIRLNMDGKTAWLENWKRKNPKKDPAKVKIPKFMSISGSKQNLFNADSLAGQKFCVVCEGEFDCLLLYQEIYDMAASITLGSATSTLGDNWLKLLLNIRRFYLALDNDEAGNNGIKKWGELVGKRGYKVHLPIGQDITDFWQAGNDLRQWVKGYLPK